MKKLFFVLFVISFLFTGKASFSQVDSSEITSSVPELMKFHDVIYLIWHESYPAKDIKALKNFVPEIKTSMEKINNAKLPGIAREKEGKWKEGLVEFNKAAEDYYKAAEGSDEQAMLNAAEILHAKFEMMVRSIRPVVKEVDEYHKILYIIYHKYFPDSNYGEIANVMDELIKRADDITKVSEEKLVKRLKDKVSDYMLAAKELYEYTVALKEVLKSNDASKINPAVEKMHSSYQKLEGIF
jgi:hypothetical protein